MAQLKAHEVDQYLNRVNPDHRVFLVYGLDAGLVSERARLLAQRSGADLSDPFSTMTLDAEDAAADPHRVADEAHTVSMFGGNRLVWIRGTTQKNLIGALQPVLDRPPTDAWIVVEAGDLKKSSPLRSRIEKSASGIALPCYQDQVRALQSVIDEELKRNGLTIDPQARRYLVSLLGDNRMASRGEVQKLCLYATGADEISFQHVADIVGDASALAIETVIDSASTGDIATMEKTYRRLIGKGTAAFQIIGSAQRHFQMLHAARCRMEARGQTASSQIGSLRPPINFMRRDLVTRALSQWTPTALERLLKRLDSVSLEIRRNTALADSLASTALLAIAIEARQKAR